MIVARSRKAISEVTRPDRISLEAGLLPEVFRGPTPGSIQAPPVANNDSYQTSDIAVLTGNLFDNDTPGDVPFEVTAVNGSALAVGREIILASGARLRVDSDGSFVYNPNGAFNSIPTTDDNFSYTIAGGDGATVTVTVFDPSVTHLGTDNPETLTGTSGDDVMDARGGDDTVNGLGGNDSIDGGTGNDILVGGAGNDTYYVDSASDTVTELAGEGYDIVISTAQTYALAAGSYVEELAGWLGGAFSGYNLTGNEFDNVLRGGNGTNTLYGLAGNDTLYSFNSNFQFLNGGIGDDIYFVHSGATVIEDAGEGYDTAYALQDLISLPALSSVELLAPDPTVARTIGVTFIGSDTVNELRGTEFADSLNGMGGADLMIGYGGNDSYSIDQVGDVVVEEVGGGTDTIRTSINFTLSENGNVENLTARNSNGTTPTTPLSLGGNSFANVITGGNGGDIIVAGSGDDTLFGLDGNDSLYGDAGNDIIDGGNGSDLMFGGEGNDTLLGQAGTDVLDGEGGTNVLDGGQGNDTYYVNSASDIVTGETSSNGNDVVYARVSYALGSGSSVRIEVLSTDSLAGTAAINLTGNEFAQEIDGNAGNNFLNGGGGADVLVGFGGDDQYYITTGNETIVEAAGQGRDVAYTVASHVLAEGIHLEVLSTTSIVGTAAINLTGNSLVQEIDGNNGANILNGGGGADTLVGFGGDDTYYVINGGEFVVESGGRRPRRRLCDHQLRADRRDPGRDPLDRLVRQHHGDQPDR